MSWYHVVFISVIISLKILAAIILKRQNKRHDKKYEIEDQRYAKRLFEEREERTELKEFNESEFWKMMDEIHSRSQQSFKNSMGVFKDVIKKYSPQELIHLDNLITRLTLEYLNQDIYAASRIIFKTNDLGTTILLMNLLMTRGEVFYKQTCINPNLIIGKEFTDIEYQVFQDVIFDVYLGKTAKLIPKAIYPEDYTLEIPGKECSDEELPLRYPELWDNFS